MASPLQAAIDHIIMAATELDIVCSISAPHKSHAEIDSYSSAAQVLRELATGLLPEQPCWPEGGADIITLEIEKRKRRK